MLVYTITMEKIYKVFIIHLISNKIHDNSIFILTEKYKLLINEVEGFKDKQQNDLTISPFF